MNFFRALHKVEDAPWIVAQDLQICQLLQLLRLVSFNGIGSGGWVWRRLEMKRNRGGRERGTRATLERKIRYIGFGSPGWSRSLGHVESSEGYN